MRSIIIIKKCKLFNFENEHELTIAYLKEKIGIIFEALKIAVQNGDVLKRIETHIKDYLVGVMQFFLLDYQPELLGILFDLIVTGSCLTTANSYVPSHQEYFFDMFRVPIFLCIMKNPADALKIFDKMLQKSPDDMFLLIEELLIFAKRNRSENSEMLASEVIKRCAVYKSLLGDVARRKDRFFNINCVAVSLMSNPMSALYSDGSPNALCIWILDELNTTSNLEKSTIMESFLVCMIDEAGGASPDLSTILSRLRDADSAAWLEKLRSNEVERSRAVQCLHALARLLEITRSCAIYEGIVRYAAGACELLATDSTSGSLRVYFAVISAEKVLKSLETIYGMFKERGSTARERLDVLRYFLLPSLESCRTPVLGKFYECNVRDMSAAVAQDLPEGDVVERRAVLVTKIGCYRLFELMFCKLPPAMIVLFVIDGKQTELSVFLMERVLKVRQLVPCYDDERELTRLLHCAAFNCFVSMACAKHDEEYFKAIFQEVRSLGQFVWERIVDCERTYELLEPNQGYRWQPISIRRIDEEVPQTAPYAAYFRRDSRRMSDLQVIGDGSNGRQWLGLEYDDLNLHECAATITGTIMHLVNSKVNRLPAAGEEPREDQLPDWLLNFRDALTTDKNNVRLFLMRIIGNTRAAFVPYLRSLFVPLVHTVYTYLAEKSLNYLIRDMLLIIVESKYKLREQAEVQEAQKLIETLIERVFDVRVQVYEYNLDILERLVIIWNDKLKSPQNLDTQIQNSNTDLVIRIILILLRHGVEPQVLVAKREVHAIVRRAMFKWQDSMTPRTFETLGWIMHYIEDIQRDVLIKKDLIDLFTDVQRNNADYCARLVCRMSESCPQLVGREEFRSFMDPRVIEDDECRAECLELFLKALSDLKVEALIPQLEYVDLKEVLRDRVLPCLDVTFRIVNKLLGLLDAAQLLPYAQLLEVYTKSNALLEHKRIAYDFFMNAYEKYANVRNEDSESLTRLSCEVLISGVADPSYETQEAVLRFWRERVGLPNGTVDRLQRLLPMYGPRVHASYAQFLVLAMLDLVAKSPDSERLLYGQLAQCRYEEYEVVAPRTRRRSRVRAPLFAPSLLAQLERAVAQQGSRLRRANQEERHHEATTHVVAETSFEQLERLMSSKASAVPSSKKPIPDPSENKLSRRIFEVSNKLCYSPPRTSAYDYFRRLRKEARLQCEGVKISRRYRLGSYPDVEITQSGVVASLQGLACTDRNFAADLVVSLICALMKQHPELQPAVGNICKLAMEQPNDFSAPALEIMLRSGCIQFDSQQVTKIAESKRLHASAIMLLERETIRRDDVIYVAPTQKKLTGVTSVLQHRLQLARLYECIGEHDVVSSIFRDWILSPDSDHLQKGYLAEMEGNWLAAKAIYEKGHETGIDLIEDHCLEGMFRCLSELSSWTQINEKVNQILNENYNSIWQNPKRDKLFPWIFTAQLQKLLEDIEMDKPLMSPLLNLLDDWISERGPALTKKFGEQISVLYLCNDPPSQMASRRCLKRCLDGAWERWMDSSWLTAESKLQILETFKSISDVDAYLRTLNSEELSSVTHNLINYWEENSPEMGNNLISWNLRLGYRLAFASILMKRLKNSSVGSDTLMDLLSSSLSQRLKVTELAINYKNKFLARKHSLRLKILFDQVDLTNSNLKKLRHDFDFVSSKYTLLCGEIENNIQEKFIYYINSWQLADSLASNEVVDLSTKIKVQRHIFYVTSVIHNFIQRNAECIQIATNNEFVSKALGITSSGDIEDILFNYSHEMLKSACCKGSADEMAESYSIFAKYCHVIMVDKYDRNSIFLKEFIESVLTAMSLGTLKTICYFPCLLKYLLYRNNDQTMQLFIDKCRNVPTWMFLSWQEQIISYLATSLKSLVLPIVERLAKDYPNAIIYSFKGICEAQPELREDPIIDAVFELLFKDKRIDTYFKAMRYLCQPELYLKYHLLDLIRISSNDKNYLDMNLKKFFESMKDQINLQGPVYKKILIKYSEELAELQKCSDIKTAKRFIETFCNSLDEDVLTRMRNEKSAESSRLDYYSPYLGDLSREVLELEVPNQYVRNEPPLTHYHARIARIDGFVQVEDGLLRIGVIGTNARTYDFLVVIGANARQHQSVQRIFEITNSILRRDLDCKKKRLLISTYSVVPLWKSLSLVRWTDGTKSLRECVEFSMRDKSVLQAVSTKYRNWIEQATDDETARESYTYKQALLKYTARDVVAKMKKLAGYISWDLLRKTFVHLSTSTDCFIQLRRNFIISYATMCMVHWIFGVGNRSLENTHIEVKTGKCIGVDFTLMFGTGFDQPIPELVPFRLTIQILGLLKPFREQDVFGLTMNNVLKALRNEKGLILDCLDIFMHEPLDWNEKLNQLWKDNNEQHQGIKWLPKKKLFIIDKKLSGAKPSNIMLEELAHVHDENEKNSQFFTLYRNIINGNELHHITARSALKNDDLTIEEQVQCLLDQATDVNALGRMWVGWCPFV